MISTSLTRIFRAVSDSIESLFNDARFTLKPAIEQLEDRTLMSTYYVSTSGKDSNSGTSPSSPWASTAKASSVSLKAGDTVLFNGGQTFGGQLTIGSGDSGSSSAPVTIGSYGTGRAKISSPSGRGIYVLNAQYINIQNLVITGGSGSSYGIKIENNLSNRTTLSHVYVDNVDVSGFGQYGIYAYVWNSGSWYNDIRITNSSVHNNTLTGITTGAGPLYGIENLYIGKCTTFENTGNSSDPNSTTGSGIMISGVSGGVVERCTSYDNGAKGNGSGGLWAANSIRVVLQYNEVYDNHTSAQRDGDGMGFDINTSFSIMQYNYVHDNDGSGLQLDNWMNNNGETNNVIRYNIAVNNGLKHTYAGLQIWGQVDNSAIYDNVVYVSAASGIGIKVHNVDIPTLVVNNIQIMNNIVITTGGRQAVDVTSDALNGAKGLVFSGNDYWPASGAVNISYGSKAYNSLSSWQAGTKQEMLNGKSVGFQVDPKLVSAGSDPTLGDATKLNTLTGYKLQSSSPLIGKGFSVPVLSGVAVAATDFFSQAVPTGSIDVGADQTKGGTTVVPPPPPPPVSPPPVSPPPVSSSSPFTSKDIGSVGSKGTVALSSGKYTITGSGADIFGTADALQYDYETLNGDGQIIAEVNSVSAANVWAKAGVMIRNGNAAGDKQVSMLVSSNHEAEFERRWSTSGDTGTTDVAASSPEWVKLVRQGNNFSGYISSDGKTWKLVATTSVVMNSSIEIGLAVTSHDPSKTETATFSNVSVLT